MKNKFLFVVVCMFLSPKAYSEKSSEKISTESNVSWAAPRAYTNQVGPREEVREPSKEGSEIFLEKIFTINNNCNWYMVGDFNLSGDLLVNGANTTGDYVPYTGSISNVALGNYNFSVGGSDFVQGGNN
ncbi:hypothetical protein HOD29_01415 [archaeon]|nr:hypothetical protein [archaeon]